MTQIALATEDMLSEAVGLQLLREINLSPPDIQCLRKDGFGYLQSKMSNWKALAKIKPVLLITDLDQVACPSEMCEAWLGTTPTPSDLLLRIAVREVESWVLADHDAMRQLMGPKGKLPIHPDELPDPKSHLLQLAKQASREVRQDLVKEKGAVASQGIGYNTRLGSMVASCWSPERAASRSPSLARTRLRLRELAARRFWIEASL
ncbi:MULTISPECIES: hypothetical protein [Giesbergeria]|uniref:DUF4276 family protein n=1 Tax=Giesbergeria sinuosa TaxID=80883 RepID=A0ABV9QE33_9BURK